MVAPVVSGAAMPSLPACCFTFVGLDSVLWDTSSAAPEERASLIWLVSWLDCIVVEIVADMSPMRANPTSDTTSSTPAAPFAKNTTFHGSVGVGVRVPWLDFGRLLFEQISAYSTAGLSTGITAALCPASRVVLILTMFLGRVGAVTLLSLWVERPEPTARYTEEAITIG